MKDGVPWRERMRREAEKRKVSIRKPAAPVKTRRVPDDHNPHLKRGIHPWLYEPMWENEIVCIIGGGPSLKTFDISVTKDQHCIAVNQSYEIAPWAEVLHYADAAWWEWNHAHILTHWPEPKLITTATSEIKGINSHKRLKRFWRDRNDFTTDKGKLHGWDSGTQAVNLAFHMGAKRIVLFGIDMQRGPKGESQWHNKHKRKTKTENYTKFTNSLRKTVAELEKRGVQVVRCTEPGPDFVPLVSVAEAFNRDYRLNTPQEDNHADADDRTSADAHEQRD